MLRGDERRRGNERIGERGAMKRRGDEEAKGDETKGEEKKQD